MPALFSVFPLQLEPFPPSRDDDAAVVLIYLSAQQVVLAVVLLAVCGLQCLLIRRDIAVILQRQALQLGLRPFDNVHHAQRIGIRCDARQIPFGFITEFAFFPFAFGCVRTYGGSRFRQQG